MSVTIGAGSPAPKPVIDGVELGNTTDSSVDALTPKSSVVEKANAFLERSPRLSLDSQHGRRHDGHAFIVAAAVPEALEADQ